MNTTCNNNTVLEKLCVQVLYRRDFLQHFVNMKQKNDNYLVISITITQILTVMCHLIDTKRTPPALCGFVRSSHAQRLRNKTESCVQNGPAEGGSGGTSHSTNAVTEPELQ